MTVQEAQRDVGRAFVGGGPGVLVSALVWLAAAFVQQRADTVRAFAVLFVGGMFIFPLSMLICRALFRRQKEIAGNPLGMTALESTIAMIAGLFGAWLFLRHDPALVFPFSAVAVGTHYFAFRTVYGDSLFWALGAIVTAMGLWQIFTAPVAGGIAFWVAIVEFIFGTILTVRAVRA
jgi:hypothetical protein